MRVETFKRLPPKRQQQLVVDQGVPLGHRESHRYSIFLYALDVFYVELYFFKDSGEYASLKPFSEVERLEPYLEEIDVAGLLA